MWGFLGFLRVAAALPLPVMHALGGGIGRALYHLAASRRRVTQLNIRQAFPHFDDAQVAALSKAAFVSLGISLFELGLAWWAPRARLQRLCKLKGFEHIEKAQREGQPILLLTGHFTALDLGGILLAMYLPLQAVYKRAHNPLFNHFMHHYRNKHLQHAYPNTETRAFMKNLKNGLATWYAPDQDFAQHDAVFTPFLGGMASTLTSTARMAKMAGAVTLPFYPKRLDGGKGYELVILPPLDNFPVGETDADAARVNQAIEQMVYANPQQYAWFHKRFKNQPDGRPSLYARGGEC